MSRWATDPLRDVRIASPCLGEREGRLCVRFFRRSDGTILTDNCPLRLRAIKRRLTGVAAACLSFVIGVCAGFLEDALGIAGAARQHGSMAALGRLPIEPSLREATVGVLAPRLGNHPGQRLRDARME